MTQVIPLPSSDMPPTQTTLGGSSDNASHRRSGIRLPQELMKCIIEHLPLDFPTLTSICLASRDLRHYAEARLYSCIRIEEQLEGIKGTQIGIEEADTLFTTIISNPRLGHLVKTVEVQGASKGGSCLEFLKPALQLMPNLKYLNLDGDRFDSDILSGPCPFKLEGFGFYCRSRYEDPDQGLVDFLVKQPSITQLALIVGRETLEALPNTACPNVTEFAGNRASIELVVPTRSTIKYLGWQQGGEDLDEITMNDIPDPINKPPSRKLIDALSAVPFLSIGPICTSRPRRLASHIIPHLAGLKVLSIIEGTFPETFREIEHLPNLQLLCVTSSMDYFLKMPSLLGSSHINRWFEQCQSLRIVAYRTHNVRKRPPLSLYRLDYKKIERGVNGSVLVSLAHIDSLIQEIVGCKAHPGVAAGRGMGIAL